MLSESTADGSQRRRGTVFWWRLTDNLFRRLVWCLVPIVGFTLLGVTQAGNTLEVYQSSGTLSASENPLVPEQQVRGVSQSFWESPAAATSRIINERLQTDTFIRGVAERAGLADAVDSGLITLQVVRDNLVAVTRGTAILSVSATWGDAQTSYELANATINQYQDFLTETIASDSAEAVDFYQSRLDDMIVERDAAERDLADFAARLPSVGPEGELPFTVQIELERLRSRIDSVEGKIAETQDSIDAAQLSVTQQTTTVGRILTVIDPPSVPNAPRSTLMQQVRLVGSFFVLGVLISATALLITSVLDKSVASAAELLTLPTVALVATVPDLRSLDAGRRRRGRLTRNRREAA